MSSSTENVILTNRILEANNFYKMLQISNDATDKEIKSAHKRLALLVHPDKNNAPKAHEAFCALSNAAAVLLDKDKRIEYDEYLHSPMKFCSDKFNLSEDSIATILLTAGICVGGLLGLTALYRSFMGEKKKENSSNKS